MPPKKRDRRRPGARPYKNYSEEMLSLAIEMVQNKKMSSYDAEKCYGIPRRTLERKIKKQHKSKPGHPFSLSVEEELSFVKVLTVAGDYGSPLTQLDLRVLVYEYLVKNGKTHIFNDKLPGEWWAQNFIERHRDRLTVRAVQNIKRARAEKTLTEFKDFFNNLENVVKNVPPSHIVNYDETNFSDDPGSVKCIFRRGIKYPERIMNSTKGCISVMFAASADGKVLPPYVVYKADSVWTQWVEGGPDPAQYNRSKSGWFDSSTFFDWFLTIIIPWARKLEGPKVIIGDNLSSHINIDVIELCEKYNIRFVLLPSNSTQLTQPLDVAFFGPLKKIWRKILTRYKIENPRQGSLSKAHFPPLLKEVMEDVHMNKIENVVSEFKATGIFPFNPHKVYKKLPEYDISEPECTVDQALLDYLKESRKQNPMKRARNKKINVQPGKSVSISDLKKIEIEEKVKKTKKNCTETKEKTDKRYQEATKHRGLETDMNIVDCTTGVNQDITVNICGTLSESDNSSNESKENRKQTSKKKNEKRKGNKKTHFNKRSKKRTKLSKNVESGSTTTEDMEISLHSDSDILNINSENEEDRDETFYVEKSPELIDLSDTDLSVENLRQTVNDIEEEIFKEIYDKDKEEKEITDSERRKVNHIDDDYFINANRNGESEEDAYKHLDDTQKEIFKEIYDKDKEQKHMTDPQRKKVNPIDDSHLDENRNAESEIDDNLNKEERKWNIGETVLTRYYSRKWKYYIGIIERVNCTKKVYSVSFYRTRRVGNDIKFVKSKRADIDSALPENSIVKSVTLLQISDNPEEYILMNDEDTVYFK